MNKIDLIIDALELAWKDNNEKFYDRYIQALAGVRELKALKPVAWQVMVENEAIKEFSIKDMAHDWAVTELVKGSPVLYWIRPLYALDEVTK
jgi:hypothetical protein